MLAFRAHTVGRKVARSLSTLFVASLAACGGGGGGDATSTEPVVPPPVASSPSLFVADTAAGPLKVLTLRLRGTSNSRDTLTVRIGATSVLAIRYDDSTLVFSVPDGLAAGRYPLVIGSSGVGGDSLVVTAPVPIPNPVAYVQSAVDSAIALQARVVAASAATAADSARLASLRSSFGTMMTRLRAASTTEQVGAARMLATNARALGIPVLPGVTPSASISASVLSMAALSCDDVRFAALNPSTFTEDGEYCAENLPGILTTQRGAIVDLLVFGSFAYVGATLTGPVGIFAGSVAAVFVVNATNTIADDIKVRLARPQPVRLPAEDDPLLSPRVASLPRGVSLSVRAVTLPRFEDSTAQAYPARLIYASPTSADVSRNSFLGSAVGGLNRIASDINRVISFIPELPAVPTLPATPQYTVVGTIPAQYLALGAVSPASVTGTATDADGKWTLKFSSSTPIVDSTKITFTVRYTWRGLVSPQSQTYTAWLLPRPALPVAKVTITPAGGRINPKDSLRIVATAFDSLNRVLPRQKITWRSSVPGTATVDTAGVVRGIAEGITTITATALTPTGVAKIAQAEVIVNPAPVASVTITPASPAVNVNETIALTAVLKDSAGNVLTGRVVTWTSSNTNVATIGSTGIASGKVLGTTTITATSEGKSGQTTLTVAQTVTGTYALKTLDGIAIPGRTYSDSLYRIETNSGAITLNTNLTFTYSISATGFNVKNTEQFDEGGSGGGTYVVTGNGSGVVFTITSRSGKTVNELANASISGKQMTVTVAVEGASGIAVLLRP